MKNMKKLHLCIATLILTLFGTTFSFANEYKAGPSGGFKKTPFSNSVGGNFDYVDSVTICSSDALNSVQMNYINLNNQQYSSIKRGGTGGSCYTFNIISGDYITKISGRYGDFVDYIQIQTYYGHSYEWGGDGGHPFTYEAPINTQIIGFHGRSGGRYIESIGVYYRDL